MTVLLLLCLPLVFFSYAFQLEAKNKHIFMFFIGITTTMLFSLLISFFSSNTDRYIDTVGSYFFYAFFVDTLIPLCVVTAVALILSGFNMITTPAALFGLFTVKIYQQLFLTSTHLRSMPIILSIIMYAGSLFILDALLHFCADITFYYFIACTICFFLFIGIFMLGTFALGIYYFKGNQTVYSAILAGIAVIGTLLHFIGHRHGSVVD